MSAEVAVTPATPDDVDAVATLHRDQLSDSFLSSLGTAFLRVLYRRIVLDPSSVLLVARRGGRIVGFVAGTESTGALYRQFLRRDAVRAAAAAAPRLLRHPYATLETLRYGGGALDETVLPSAELLSLAVAPDARRMGLGGTLIAALQAALAERGVRTMRVTVAADNEAAVAAYRRSGFVTVTQFEVHRGRTSEVLVWS